MKIEGCGNSPGHQKAERLVEWNKTNPTDRVAHRLARLVYRMLKYGQHTLTKVWSTTTRDTATNKSNCSSRRLPNSGCSSCPRWLNLCF